MNSLPGMKKYFDIFELDESALIAELEQAYKELSHAWRPENFQNFPRHRRKAELKLQEINEAYTQLKSYLAARPQPEALPQQTDQDLKPSDAAPEPQAPAEPSQDSEPEPTPERSLDSPPWEPQYPTQPEKVISRPQTQKTVQKSLIFGLVAILAVLAVLLFYRLF